MWQSGGLNFDDNSPVAGVFIVFIAILFIAISFAAIVVAMASPIQPRNGSRAIMKMKINRRIVLC